MVAAIVQLQPVGNHWLAQGLRAKRSHRGAHFSCQRFTSSWRAVKNDDETATFAADQVGQKV